MYIKRILISNIRAIQSVEWVVEDPLKGGWHVVIGDNGSGKSTFMRSIALALVGPREASALRQDWNTWLRSDSDEGVIRLDVSYDESIDKFSGKGNTATRRLLPVGVSVLRQGELFEQPDRFAVIEKTPKLKLNPERYVWGGRQGWFSAAFGPFRRFSGGDKDYERIYYSNPKLAAHLSVFGENIALTECIRWLQDLQFKKLEQHHEGVLLDHITDFINQDDFLSHKVYLRDISSEGVYFVDGNENRVNVEELSDGYRSVLSMTFELIRQLSRVYEYHSIFDPDDNTRILAPGVVLVDEIDAHLHPTWQRRIGLWFRDHFPNMQFIVTTHSPLVCQAATVGTVFRLPKPGSQEYGGMVTGIELDRLLYGNVLDAYGTEMFGANVIRSEASRAKLRRLAELNQKEMRDSLSEEERVEQAELRAILPTAAHQTALRNNESI